MRMGQVGTESSMDSRNGKSFRGRSRRFLGSSLHIGILVHFVAIESLLVVVWVYRYYQTVGCNREDVDSCISFCFH